MFTYRKVDIGRSSYNIYILKNYQNTTNHLNIEQHLPFDKEKVNAPHLPHQLWLSTLHKTKCSLWQKKISWFTHLIRRYEGLPENSLLSSDQDIKNGLINDTNFRVCHREGPLWGLVYWIYYVNLTQLTVILEEIPSIEKMPQPEWPMSKVVGHFLDWLLMCEGLGIKYTFLLSTSTLS